VKKPQLIVTGAALLLVFLIYFFGKTVPDKNKKTETENIKQSADDGHEHGSDQSGISTDTILFLAKKSLSPEQVVRLNTLENSISRGDVKDQQLHVYHQLARFWSDSAHNFEPFAWYTAEAARLENSEKSLTFAARLFLDNLQNDDETRRRIWKAFQAKDLFERSLKINPNNDSAKIGIGACYMFGDISPTPMEGILKIREVVERDSTNLYAQMMLVKGSILSGQYDKAINRLESINHLQTKNIEAILMLADLYERTGDKAKAISWYQKSISLINQPEIKKAVEKRITELKK